MESTDWLKPALLGAGAGALAAAFIGFAWGGWVTGMKAEAMAADRAQTAVVSALLPICVERAKADPESVAKLQELKDASSYRRPEVLMQTGWATVPGVSDPDRGLARACAAQLTEDL